MIMDNVTTPQRVTVDNSVDSWGTCVERHLAIPNRCGRVWGQLVHAVDDRQPSAHIIHITPTRIPNILAVYQRAAGNRAA